MNAPVAASGPGALSLLTTETRKWLTALPLGQVRDGSEAAGRGSAVEDEDPGSGQMVAEFAAADTQDVDLAVRSARAAREDGRWARRTRSIASGRCVPWPISWSVTVGCSPSWRRSTRASRSPKRR